MRGGGGGGVDRPVRALHHNHRAAELWIEELLTLATFRWNTHYKVLGLSAGKLCSIQPGRRSRARKVATLN